MTIWTPCSTCELPSTATDHNDGCPFTHNALVTRFGNDGTAAAAVAIEVVKVPALLASRRQAISPPASERTSATLASRAIDTTTLPNSHLDVSTPRDATMLGATSSHLPAIRTSRAKGA